MYSSLFLNSTDLNKKTADYWEGKSQHIYFKLREVIYSGGGHDLSRPNSKLSPLVGAELADVTAAFKQKTTGKSWIIDI